MSLYLLRRHRAEEWENTPVSQSVSQSVTQLARPSDMSPLGTILLLNYSRVSARTKCKDDEFYVPTPRLYDVSVHVLNRASHVPRHANADQETPPKTPICHSHAATIPSTSSRHRSLENPRPSSSQQTHLPHPSGQPLHVYLPYSNASRNRRAQQRTLSRPNQPQRSFASPTLHTQYAQHPLHLIPESRVILDDASRVADKRRFGVAGRDVFGGVAELPEGVESGCEEGGGAVGDVGSDDADVVEMVRG